MQAPSAPSRMELPQAGADTGEGTARCPLCPRARSPAASAARSGSARRRLALGDARPQVCSWLHGLTLPGALLCVALSHSAPLAAPRSSSEGFSAETCQVQPLSVVCLLLGQTPQQALRGSETSACGRSPALPVRDLPGDLCDLGQRHGTPRVSCPSLPVNRGVDLTNGGGFLEMTTLVRPSSVPSVGRNGVEAQRSGRRAPLSSWSEERRQVSSCWLRPDP